MGTFDFEVPLKGTATLPDDLTAIDPIARDAAAAAAAEAARANERIDALPAPTAAQPYDDTAIRDAIANHDERLAALETAPAQAPAPAPSGNDIRLSDMPGATDDDRLAAAIAASKSDPSRVIRFDYRDTGRRFTRTQVVHSGLRILGPNTGWQNPEQNVRQQCTIKVDVGTGANSWLVGTGTTFDVVVAGLTVQSGNGASQFYHHPYIAGTSYASLFADLTLYGFKHGFGMPGDAMSITLTHFAGTIQFPGLRDTAISLRGSDSFYTAKTNLDANLGGGKYLLRLENLVKSELTGLYLTARGATRAVYSEAPNTGQGSTFLHHCIIEGHNAGDPALGALVVNRSGQLFLDSCSINFGMANPSAVGTIDTALVVVLDGQVSLERIGTNKATATPDASPLAHVSGGTLRVGHVQPGGGGQVPVVRRTGTGKLNPPAFSLVEV